MADEILHRYRCFPSTVHEQQVADDITSTYEGDGNKLSAAFKRWQLTIKHPCDNCKKDTVKPVVGTINEVEPDLLCADLVATMAASVCSEKLDWELVSVIVRTIKKFVENEQRTPSERDEIVLKMNLLPTARKLLRRYFVDGRAIGDADNILMDDVLDLLWMGFHASDDTHPDEQLTSDLIKCFISNPSKVFPVVCVAIGSIRNSEEYYQFWDGFSAGIRMAHRDPLLNTDPKFGHEYAMVLINHEKAFETKHGHRHTSHFMSQWCLCARALLEVLQKTDMIPSRQMLVFITKHAADKRTAEVVRSAKFIYRKIANILLNEPMELHHEADRFASETANQMIRKRLNLQLEQSESLSFLNDVVETMNSDILRIIMARIKYFGPDELDLDLINVFFRLANYDYFNKESYKNLLTCIIDYCMYFKKTYEEFDEAFLRSAIPQTIREIINNLHKQCSLCEKVFFMMDMLFRQLNLNAKAILKVANEPNRTERAKLMTGAVPYVVRNRVTLIEVMKAGGFHFMTEELQQGEHVDSLQKLGQAFGFDPDGIITRNTVSCTTNQQVRDEDTRVIVLDDGTKIRTKTSPLVKNSEFFSNLFGGMFAEASLEEIRLHGVTAFQFHFIVNFIDAPPSSTCGINFKMDVDEHLDLIILCDKLMLVTLREQVVNSLKCDRLTVELCLEIYNVSLFYGIKSLRRACVNFALVGDVSHGPTLGLLQRLLENTADKKLLVEDVKEWMKDVCDGHDVLT